MKPALEWIKEQSSNPPREGSLEMKCMIEAVEAIQLDASVENTKWLIWSHEHKAWWAANEMGYVSTRRNAGRYTFKRACEIVENANFALEREPHEAMVLDNG